MNRRTLMDMTLLWLQHGPVIDRYRHRFVWTHLSKLIRRGMLVVQGRANESDPGTVRWSSKQTVQAQRCLKKQQQALVKHLKKQQHHQHQQSTSPYTKSSAIELLANETLYCKLYVTGFCNTVFNTRTEIWKVYPRTGMGLTDVHMQLAELLVDKFWVAELASASKKELQPELQHPLQLPETLLAVCGFMGLDLPTVVGFLIPHLQMPSNSQHKQETLYELGIVYPEFSQCYPSINSRAEGTRFPYARLLDTEWLGFTVDVHSYNGYDCSAGVLCQNDSADEVYGPRQTRMQALGMRMDMIKLIYEKYKSKVVPPMPHEFIYGLFSRTCRDLPLLVNLFSEYVDFIKRLTMTSIDFHTAFQFESLYKALTGNAAIKSAMQQCSSGGGGADDDDDLDGNFEMLRQLIMELNDIIVQGNAKAEARRGDLEPMFTGEGEGDEDEDEKPEPHVYVPLTRKLRRKPKLKAEPLLANSNTRVEDRSTGVRAVAVPQVSQELIEKWFGSNASPRSRQQAAKVPVVVTDSDSSSSSEEEEEEMEEVEAEGQVHITPEYKTPTSADSSRMTPLIDNQRNLYPQDPGVDLPLWSRILTEQIDPATGVLRDMAGKMCLPVTENQIMTACFAVLAHMTGSIGEDIASEEWETANNNNGQNPHECCGVCGTSRYKVFNKRWRDIDQAFGQMMQAVMADDCTKSLYRKWQSNSSRCYVCRWIPFICDAVRDVMSYVFDFAVQERERLAKVTQLQHISPHCIWLGLESRVASLNRNQKPMHAHFLQALYYFRNVDQMLEHQCQRRWNASDFVHVVVPPGKPFYSTDQHEMMVRVRLDSAASYVISHQYAAESTVFALKSIASNLRRQRPDDINSVKIEMAEDGRSITMPQYLLDYIQVHYAPGCSTDAWKRGMPAAMHPDYRPPRSMHVPERLVQSECNVKSQPLGYALQWPAALADWHAEGDDRRVARAVVWLKRLCDRNKGHYVGGDTLCFSDQVDVYRQLLDGLLNTLFPLGAVHMADAMLFHFRAEDQQAAGNILTNPTEIISMYDLLWNFIHMKARFILFSKRMLCFLIDHLEAPGQQQYQTRDTKRLLLICHIILTRGRDCSQSDDWVRVANTTIEEEHRANNPYVIPDLDKYYTDQHQTLGYWFYLYCSQLHLTRRDMSGARRSEVAREVCQGMIPYDRRNVYASVKPTSLFSSTMLRNDTCHAKHPICSIRNKSRLYYQWTKFNGLLDGGDADDKEQASPLPCDRISMVGVLFAIVETMALLPDAVPPTRSTKEEHGAVDVRNIRENEKRRTVLAALPGCPSKIVLKKNGTMRTSEFEYYVPRGLLQPEVLLDLAVFEGSHVYDQPSPASSDPPILAAYNEEWTGVCFYPRDQIMPLWSSIIRPSHCDKSPGNEHMLPFATMFAPFTNSHPQLLSRLLISQQSGDYFDLEQLMFNLRSHRLTRGFYSVMKPGQKGQEPLVASRSFREWMEKSWAYRWYDDDTLQTSAEADEMYQLVRYSKIDPSGSMTYLITENLVQELRVSLSSSSPNTSPLNDDDDDVFLDNVNSNKM